jgi:hypothetical protein
MGNIINRKEKKHQKLIDLLTKINEAMQSHMSKHKNISSCSVGLTQNNFISITIYSDTFTLAHSVSSLPNIVLKHADKIILDVQPSCFITLC